VDVLHLLSATISDRKWREDQLRESQTRDVAIFALAKLAESRRSGRPVAHLERVQHYCLVLAQTALP